MPELSARAGVLHGQDAHHVEVHGFKLFHAVVIHETALTHLNIRRAIGTDFANFWILRMGTFMKINELPNGLRAFDAFLVRRRIDDDGRPSVVI